MENQIKLIRLRAACQEWRALYRLNDNAARHRMSELSSEITRLENETGTRSRDIA